MAVVTAVRTVRATRTVDPVRISRSDRPAWCGPSLPKPSGGFRHRGNSCLPGTGPFLCRNVSGRTASNPRLKRSPRTSGCASGRRLRLGMAGAVLLDSDNLVRRTVHSAIVLPITAARANKVEDLSASPVRLTFDGYHRPAPAHWTRLQNVLSLQARFLPEAKRKTTQRKSRSRTNSATISPVRTACTNGGWARVCIS